MCACVCACVCVCVCVCVCICMYMHVCVYEDRKVCKDKELNKEVPNNPSVLANVTIKTLQKIYLRGDLSSDIQCYYFVEDPKFARFYLFPMYLVGQ